MAEEKKKMSQKIKITIAVLLGLFILSAGALTVRVVYLNFFKDNTSTMVVHDNLIGETDNVSTAASENSDTTALDTDGITDTEASDSTESEDISSEAPAPTGRTAAGNGGASNTEKNATVIELYKDHPSDNEKFQVENMLPSDTEVKYFAVKLSHHADATVYFSAIVTEQTKNLANVLHIKITHLENEKVIYDGTFADMDVNGYGETFAATQNTETVASYKIVVSLPSSTGNDYQLAKLMADFNWFVEDTGPLAPPQTGDNGNIMPYAIIMCFSLIMIIILLFFRRRKKEDCYAETK